MCCEIWRPPQTYSDQKSPTALLTLPLPALGPKSPMPQSRASSFLNTTEHESASRHLPHRLRRISDGDLSCSSARWRPRGT